MQYGFNSLLILALFYFTILIMYKYSIVPVSKDNNPETLQNKNSFTISYWCFLSEFELTFNLKPTHLSCYLSLQDR